MSKPKVNSSGEKELDKVAGQFEEFDKQVKDLTLDRMNQAPKLEHEPQTKMAQKDIDKARDIYLKPERTISCRDKFNEDFRDQWNFAKEYVQFIAENKEIIGETIEMWTKPFAGIPAEFWKIPCNKPLWAPRYVAEQVKRACYHRLTMQQNTVTSADSMGSYYGSMVVDSTIQRLDALPVSGKRSIFMGANSF